MDGPRFAPAPASPTSAPIMRRVEQEAHPVGLAVTDDLRRSRLRSSSGSCSRCPTSSGSARRRSIALFIAVIAWVVALVKGRVPDGLHDFFVMLVRYSTHVHAYPASRGEPLSGLHRSAGVPGGRGDRARRRANAGSPCSCDCSSPCPPLLCHHAGDVLLGPRVGRGLRQARRHDRLPRLVRRSRARPHARRHARDAAAYSIGTPRRRRPTSSS